MGITAKKLSAKYHISRHEQDELAELSYRQARNAQGEGKFKEEIVAVPVPTKKELFW